MLRKVRKAIKPKGWKDHRMEHGMVQLRARNHCETIPKTPQFCHSRCTIQDLELTDFAYHFRIR